MHSILLYYKSLERTIAMSTHALTVLTTKKTWTDKHVQKLAQAGMSVHVQCRRHVLVIDAEVPRVEITNILVPEHVRFRHRINGTHAAEH